LTRNIVLKTGIYFWTCFIKLSIYFYGSCEHFEQNGANCIVKLYCFLKWHKLRVKKLRTRKKERKWMKNLGKISSPFGTCISLESHKNNSFGCQKSNTFAEFSLSTGLSCIMSVFFYCTVDTTCHNLYLTQIIITINQLTIIFKTLPCCLPSFTFWLTPKWKSGHNTATQILPIFWSLVFASLTNHRLIYLIYQHLTYSLIKVLILLILHSLSHPFWICLFIFTQKISWLSIFK